MMERLRQLFNGSPKAGSSGKHPIGSLEVEPAPLPPHLQDQESEREKLSLRLMAEAIEMHNTAAKIRKALGREVAIKLQRRA